MSIFVNRNTRVLVQGITGKQGAFHTEKMLEYIRESGNSSWKWLQNGYVIADPAEQSIPLTLALSEAWMKKKKRGVCRIHGGGFAGVVMCVVPKEDTEEFTEYLAPYVGRENIYNMGIRQAGAIWQMHGDENRHPFRPESHTGSR